jgi:hypothetical protein
MHVAVTHSIQLFRMGEMMNTGLPASWARQISIAVPMLASGR